MSVSGRAWAVLWITSCFYDVKFRFLNLSYLCVAGPKAKQFRIRGAGIVVRALGGDETLVAEIRQNAAAQVSIPAEHPMQLFGETVEAAKPKRSLDDDEDLYVVRKKRVMMEEERQLVEANQSLMATRIQGWKGLLQGLEGLFAQLSDHAVPGALQNILVCRTNTTNKLLSAAGALVDQASAEHGAPLAITAAPAQPAAGSMLSRVTVLDVGRELRLSAAQLKDTALCKVGLKARDLWFAQGGADLEMKAAGGWMRTEYSNGTKMPSSFVKWTSKSESIEPEWTSELLNTHRIKYSCAFAGAHELGLSKAHNTWTYPVSTGKQMLLQAFKDTAAVHDEGDDLYA